MLGFQSVKIERCSGQRALRFGLGGVFCCEVSLMVELWLGVGALVGAVAGAVAAETQLLQVVASAWKSSAPFIDADKLAITGHAMGAVVALLTASLTDDYKSVIASSPTGGMAYAFEKTS